MSNRRISELNQLYSNDFDPSDLLISVDIDTGAGLPETKKVLIGDFTDYLVAQTTGSISASVSDLSQSVVELSQSVSSLESATGSYATLTQLSTKLDNSLTASFGVYVAYGLPVLDSGGLIYSNFLPDYVFTFNGRSGNVLPIYGDYSASMIEFSASTEIPHSDVQSAIDFVKSSSVNKSGDTMTGILTLVSDPVGSLDAATKDYVDGRVSKSGDTMTGTLDTTGIIVDSNLIYAVQGTSSVGMGTNDPTESSKLHVVGRVRLSEIQFDGDESIISSSLFGGGIVTSFNTRTGSVVPLISDYLGFYVDSFNGRTGAVVPDASDYVSYYITTTGNSILLDGGITFNNSFALFSQTATSSNDTSSLVFAREDESGSIINLSVFQNATSSLNGLIQDGDIAFVFNTTLTGSGLPEYDNGDQGLVLGPYSSGSKGIRITKNETTINGPVVLGSTVEFSDTTVQSTAFIPYITSSTFVTSTPITASHGLGRHPYMLQAKLRCVTIDGTFNVDDEVPVLMANSSIYSTPTDIYFLPKTPLIREKDGTIDATITDANWVVVLTAF